MVIMLSQKCDKEVGTGCSAEWRGVFLREGYKKGFWEELMSEMNLKE